MLPEEQLVMLMQQKRAGLFDLYGQQSNLGGGAFTNEEDPLTSLLGTQFNEKYRGEYQDTLKDSLFGSKDRLTSRTGARLLNDINEMNDRGVAALHGLAANKDKSLAWFRDINNSRIGVGGYTQEQADKDYNDIADKITMAARLKRTGDTALFNDVAKKYVKGQLTGTINSLKGAMNNLPAIARPFVTNIADEFKPNARSGIKVQSTTPSGKVDEGKFTGKTDKRDQKSNMFTNFANNAGSFLGNITGKLSGALSGSGNYLLPALLLGMLGGGINKARGGSFLGPLLLMTLLGGAYGIGRQRGILPNTPINNTIDKVTNKINNTAYKGFNAVKQTVSPYITQMKAIPGKFTKKSEYIPYTECTVADICNRNIHNIY